MTTEPAQDLLARIQAGALDPTSDLATILRHCLALGSETGSVRLREWASRELKGYDADDDLPPYRVTHALLFLDGFTGSTQVRRQQVSAALLPDVARELPDRAIELREPLAELIHITDSARLRGDSGVSIAPSGAPQLVAMMNHELAQAERGGSPWDLRPTQTIERIYWAVPLSTFTGITDTVRTILVELVAEMRAALPKGEAHPTQEIADQAVSVAVYGNRNRVVVSQAAPTGTAVAGGTTANIGDEPESWARRWGWWIGLFATVVGAVAAVIVVFH